MILCRGHDQSRSFWIAALSILLIAILGLTVGAAPVMAAATDHNSIVATNTQNDPEGKKALIAINASQSLAQISPSAFGFRVSFLGNERTDTTYFYRTAAGKAKLREFGARALGYSTDLNDWSAPYDYFTAVPVTYPSWLDSNEFTALNATLHSKPIIEANITITCKQTDVLLPPSALNVTCRKTKVEQTIKWLEHLKSIQAPIEYVVLGVEPYAGCLYWRKGINCLDKAGRHRVALSQQDYAARVVKWAKAIKKLDPSIKIGAHLQPGISLCKRNAATGQPPAQGGIASLNQAPADGCGAWDQTVLSVAGEYIDFVVVHQYSIIRNAASTEQEGQALSYYQEQLARRVNQRKSTAFPFQIREELIQWLPAKMNMPIVVAEFNASYLDHQPSTELDKARQSLYTGMAVSELYLDLLQPVKTSKGLLAGAERALLLGMFAPELRMARIGDLSNPDSMVYFPGWNIFTMLKPLMGKSILPVTVTGNPNTAVERPALNVYAVRKGSKVWLVVYNHHTKAVKGDLVFTGFTPKSAKIQQLGANSSGFLAMNDATNPNRLTPQSRVMPRKRFVQDTISAFKFPAHSVTVLKIKGN